jgi:hypothetical protein
LDTPLQEQVTKLATLLQVVVTRRAALLQMLVTTLTTRLQGMVTMLATLLQVLVTTIATPLKVLVTTLANLLKVLVTTLASQCASHASSRYSIQLSSSRDHCGQGYGLDLIYLYQIIRSVPVSPCPMLLILICTGHNPH